MKKKLNLVYQGQTMNRFPTTMWSFHKKKKKKNKNKTKQKYINRVACNKLVGFAKSCVIELATDVVSI